MTIISFLFAEGMSEKNSNASFFLLNTRAWELLSGSITAFIVQKNGVKKNALSILEFFAVVFSILVYDGSTPYPGRYTLAPGLGVMLIVMYSNKDTYVAKILNTKAFISIGLVSYSAYLWHQPIFALARQYFVSELTALTNSILIIIILVLSIVTRRYIEQPVCKLKKLNLIGI
jgi:peptidoglycan/LPS O-acetylase OafA/YrhL